MLLGNSDRLDEATKHQIYSGILWNDPAVGVEWPMPEGMTQADLILSDKDKVHGGFDAYCRERGIVR